WKKNANLAPFNNKCNLPSNCTWNKNANLAPFNNNNNMGNFARCVKYVIQNLAVYGYVYQANAWQIVSWMPQVQNLYANAVTADNNIFTSTKQVNEMTQLPTPKKFVVKTSQPFLDNSDLQNTAFVIYQSINANVNILQTYGFKTNNNNLEFYWTSQNNQNGNYTISVFNPNTQTEIYNSNTFLQNKNSVTINYGDIIGLKHYAGNQILTDGLAANLITNNNFSTQCSQSLNIGETYASEHNETNYYEVTKSGLVPYQNVLQVNVNCLQDSENAFNLTGVALANHGIVAIINGQKFYGISNSEGYFSIPIVFSKPLALGTAVTVHCMGCLDFSSQLVGANPINSGLLFQIGANFGFLPDGYTGCYQLWNSNLSQMPIYNNPDTSSNNMGYDSNSQIIPNKQQYQDINFILTDTYTNNQGKECSSSITINDQGDENCTTSLSTQLQQLKFNPNYTNTLTLEISNLFMPTLFAAISNGNCIPVNSNQGQIWTTYTFTITNNSFSSPNPNSSTVASNMDYDMESNGRYASWAARNFCLVSDYDDIGASDGTFMDDSNIANALIPNAAMWKKVKELTAGYQNDFDKALAIVDWVADNMTYSYTYQYGHLISQNFNHLEGECGIYATLATVMCSMAGLVARVISGNCDNAPSYFSNNQVNHAWMQVWDEQLGAWVTIDPTWNWSTPFGAVQAQFNLARSAQHVCLVLWPQGTNYFSYFQGHSYAALLNLGCFFDYRGGVIGTYYPMKYAAYLSQLLHQTTSLTGEQSNVVNL
ncbi:MAG: transglutaminase domain-containing protein, partial [Mycoplasmataceae bacterium]|nr:transglutaminase domain-containing protein [Mycoplasmataceae bacterium]